MHKAAGGENGVLFYSEEGARGPEAARRVPKAAGGENGVLFYREEGARAGSEHGAPFYREHSARGPGAARRPNWGAEKKVQYLHAPAGSPGVLRVARVAGVQGKSCRPAGSRSRSGGQPPIRSAWVGSFCPGRGGRKCFQVGWRAIKNECEQHVIVIQCSARSPNPSVQRACTHCPRIRGARVFLSRRAL